MGERPELLIRALDWLLDQPEVREFLSHRLRELRDEGEERGPAVSIVSDPHSPLLLTIPQAAQLLATSRSRVYELVMQGRIPSVRLGAKSIRIPRQGLVEWVMKAGLEDGRQRPSRALSSNPMFTHTGKSSGRTRSKVASEVQAPKVDRPVSSDQLHTTLTIKQTAKRLGISESRTRQMIRDNVLPNFRSGTRVYITEDHLAEFMRHGQKPPEEGWEVYFRKRNFALMSEKTKREVLEAGYDPESGLFEHERGTDES